VAFQGGGAKFFGLLASAEAVWNSEKEGLIKVTRVSGTSAGAIIAMFYAFRINPLEIRKYIEKIKLSIFIFPSLMIFCLFSFIYPILLVYLLLFVLKGLNASQLIVAPVKKFIIKIITKYSKIDFKKNNESDLIFGNYKICLKTDIDLIVTASNLEREKQEEYNESRTPNYNIIAAVLDSCAIPFLFRMKGIIFDGGNHWKSSIGFTE